MGFIAQEAVNIIPEVVDNEGDLMSMQYAPITALLVEAIKEQQKQIEKLQQENGTLKGLIDKNKEQEKEIAELKRIVHELQVSFGMLGRKE